jgi:hypothetical protein
MSTTENPSTTAPALAKRKPDKRAFEPNADQRLMIEAGAAIGLTEAEMCLLITNPKTGKPIDLKTLRAHFHDELETGHVKAHIKVGAGLFKNATTPTPLYPGGNPVCQFFWLKCRLRWKQNHEGEDLPPPVVAERAGELEIARRFMFVMESAARQGKPKPALPAPPTPTRKREVA